MSDKQPIILTKNEIDVWMHDLRSIGISRVRSSILITGFILPEFKSKDVESKFGLQQPEVSMGLTKMNKEGLVSSKSLPSKGLGRPIQIYFLTKSLEDIILHIFKEQSIELANVDKVVKKIRKKLTEVIN